MHPDIPEEGRTLAKDVNIEGAIAIFQRVLDVYEQAVAPDPNDAKVRDSRGPARTLTGDTDGTIEDFQAYVGWAEQQSWASEKQKLIAKRKRWIQALQAGENPFTPEVLEELRNE